ncbi:redoxin domain-containing protein [Bernardetia sp. ABR2-2B]|uniref:redoxin domain-containing protein n=1 Tax=Bernardetia sp. ABR2-2B TaxID=3127472 RepID=UPI0030D42EB2
MKIILTLLLLFSFSFSAFSQTPHIDSRDLEEIQEKLDLYLEYYPDSAQKIALRKKIESFFETEKQLSRSNAMEFVEKLNQELKKENELFEFSYKHTSLLSLYSTKHHFVRAAKYDSLDEKSKIYSKKWIKNYEIKNGRSEFPYTSEYYKKGFFSFLRKKDKYINTAVLREKMRKAALISQNYGIANQEIQEGNIRYLKLTEWLFDKDIEKTKSLVNFIKEGNALVLDLRNVKYGNLESIATLLHVFSEENNKLINEKQYAFGNYQTAQNQILPITLPTKESNGKEGKKFAKAIKKLSRIDSNLPIYILTNKNTAGLTNFFIHFLQKKRPKTTFVVGQPTSENWQLTKECDIYSTMPFIVPFATLRNTTNEKFNYSILPTFYSQNPKETAFLKAFQNFKEEYQYPESKDIMEYVQTYFEADQTKLNDSITSTDFLQKYTGKYENEKIVLIDKTSKKLLLIHYNDTISLKQINENTFMPKNFYQNKQATKNDFFYMNMNVQPVFYNFSLDKQNENKEKSYKMNIKYSDKTRISYDFEEEIENSFFDKNKIEVTQPKVKTNIGKSIMADENLDSLRQIFAKLDFKERTRLFKTYTLNNPAQDFEVETITGDKYMLSDLAGKVIVINYWFIGRAPCLQEMPQLNKLAEEYAGKGVIFLAVSRMDTKKQIEKFLQKKQFYYDIMADSKILTENYFIPLFPTNIIIDRTGTVIFGEIGYKESIYEEMKRALNSLIVE